MYQQFCICAVAFSFLASSANSAEWDDRVDEIITAYKSSKEPKMSKRGERIETLFRSHRLSHIQIFGEKNGKRVLAADMYYGEGELHVLQRGEGLDAQRHPGTPNLVTKGAKVYEWKVGQKTGDKMAAIPKDMVDYAIYLTDPAGFPSYLYSLYLKEPELFDAPRPGESGCMELRLKAPHKSGFRAIHIDQKRFWYGAFELEDRETGEVWKIIYTKPKAIDRIPDEVYERLKGVHFRESNSTLRKRHMHYL